MNDGCLRGGDGGVAPTAVRRGRRIHLHTLFGNTNSTWGRLPWTRSGLFNPIESDLMRVPAFRRLLVRELENKTACGHVEWRAPNYDSLTLTNLSNLNATRTLDLPEGERRLRRRRRHSRNRSGFDPPGEHVLRFVRAT